MAVSARRPRRTFADPATVREAFDGRIGRQSKLSLVARLWCLAAENAAYVHLEPLLLTLTIEAEQYSYGPRDYLSRSKSRSVEVALTDKVAAKAKAKTVAPETEAICNEWYWRVLDGKRVFER
jgi:hypothetical protein